MKHLLTTAAILVALAAPAMAQNLPAFKSDSETCACVNNVCDNACIRKPDPDVVAALRKRFRDLDETDIAVFYDGGQGYDVAFWTPKGHMACSLTLKPVKLTNCRQVHA
jgi:hypothetical protein